MLLSLKRYAVVEELELHITVKHMLIKPRKYLTPFSD